jgi:hypothetical protein
MTAGKIIMKEDFRALISVSEVAGFGSVRMATGTVAKTTRATTSNRHLSFAIGAASTPRKKDPVNTR